MPAHVDITRNHGRLAGLSLSGPSSPERAKASQDWHAASRRMLHPRSVWSPPTPKAKLPELPDTTHESSPTNSGDVDVDNRPTKRSSPPSRVSPLRADKASTPPSPIRVESPAPDMLADQSQETSFSAPLITPENSFRIDEKGHDSGFVSRSPGKTVKNGEVSPLGEARYDAGSFDPINLAQTSIIQDRNRRH